MKMIGVALLSLVPILFGFFRANEIEQNQKRKTAFLKFLEEIHFQIKNFSKNQILLYENFENKVLEKDGFLEDLRLETKKAPWGAFERAVLEYLSILSCSNRARETLSDFAKRFGMQSKEAQLKDLEKMILIWEEEEKNEKMRVEGRAKVSRMTGLTAGLGIFILLI